MADINVDWSAAPNPSPLSDMTTAVSQGVQQGQQLAAVSALHGIDIDNPDSMNRGIANLVRAGAADQAGALMGLQLSRFTNAAKIHALSTPLIPDASAQQPQPGAQPPAQPGADPGAQQQAILTQAKQTVDSLAATPPGPARITAFANARAALTQAGMPGPYIDHMVPDPNDTAHLQSISQTLGNVLDHPQFGGTNPNADITPHAQSSAFGQAPNYANNPTVINNLAQRESLGLPVSETGKVLGESQGYNGVLSPGQETSFGGAPSGRQTPYAPTTLSPGQQEINTNSGSPIGASPAYPHTFEQVAPANTGVTFNPSTGEADVARDGGGGPSAPTPGASNGTRGDRNNNPGNLKVLPNGKYPGQTGMDPQGFATFDNPSDGYAAADKNLVAKQSVHGLQSLNDIIAAPHVGWNPGDLGEAGRVAAALGIDPSKPIDLQANPMLRHQVLAALVSKGEGNTVPGQRGTGQPIAGKTLAPPAPMAGGSGLYQRGFDGSVNQVGGTGISPSDSVNSVRSNPAVTGATAGVTAYSAMAKNAGQMTGPGALGMLSSMAQAYPELSSKAHDVPTILSAFGIAPKMVGQFQQAFAGKGPLTPDMRQQLLDAAYSFTQAHYGTAQQVVNGQRTAVQATGGDPKVLDGVLPQMPPPLYVTPPPAQSRVRGKVIDTPRGQRMWNGSGWVPVNAGG